MAKYFGMGDGDGDAARLLGDFGEESVAFRTQHLGRWDCCRLHAAGSEDYGGSLASVESLHVLNPGTFHHILVNHLLFLPTPFPASADPTGQAMQSFQLTADSLRSGTPLAYGSGS